MACQRCRWGTCASLDDYDNHIRADERAKIVAMLEAMAKEKFTEPASNDLLRAAKRVLSGEHRPKPGQPKEGE